MSVDYKAIYGYGYHITNDMYQALEPKKFDEFIDHDMTHIVCGWSGNSDYFFGIVVKTATEGNPIEVIPFFEYEHEECMKMFNDFHYFFPEVVTAPKHYVIQQIN